MKDKIDLFMPGFAFQFPVSRREEVWQDFADALPAGVKNWATIDYSAKKAWRHGDGAFEFYDEPTVVITELDAPGAKYCREWDIDDVMDALTHLWLPQYRFPEKFRDHCLSILLGKDDDYEVMDSELASAVAQWLAFKERIYAL